MKNNVYRSMDSPRDQAVFDFLHQLLFELLLRTEGRTTDMLEALTDEKMSVKVIRQKQVEESFAGAVAELPGGPYYMRESVLVGTQSRLTVSHNVALVCAKYVPAPLFEALAAKHEGIGKTINYLGLPTSRQLGGAGWQLMEEAEDLFRRPLKLRFPQKAVRVPFKKYALSFGAVPGIHMLEYFNPDLVRERLARMWPGDD